MHIVLYEVNVRVLLRELGATLSRPATLDDVSMERVNRWRDYGIGAIWLMGVWTTGRAARELARSDPELRNRLDAQPPGWTVEDVGGSPYAIQDYRVPLEFGGEKALRELRGKLHRAGLGLVLDFVPNHTAQDHGWVACFPEYYVQGDSSDLSRHPDRYRERAGRVMAFGRDPYFPGWRDTFQLDYRRPDLRQAMIRQLVRVAAMCDGVRCDMAMLVLKEVFKGTWGSGVAGWVGDEFWPEAIAAVREQHPGFSFIGEVYWGMEGRVRAQGFDFVYQKELYDHIVAHRVREVCAHLHQNPMLAHSVHFLENHDEPRIASLLRDRAYRRAATILLMSLPGMRMIHDGQIEGRKVHHPIQLNRRVDEALDPEERRAFEGLLYAVRESSIGRGDWELLQVQNGSSAGGGAGGEVIGILWCANPERRDLVVIQLGDAPFAGRVFLRFEGMARHCFRLEDRLSGLTWMMSGEEMEKTGLGLRLAPFGGRIVSIQAV